MTSDRETHKPSDTTAAPSFLAMIGAEDKADTERQARFAEILAQHRASRARRDPAITAALRARFGVNTQADAA